MNDDLKLLREYACHNSDEAFATLVSRHINLVYSVALRRVRNPQLAEEITQAVFVILAQKAASLGDDIVLSGWLCRTARYASANALTMQWRRQRREQEAFMQMENEPSPAGEADAETWSKLAPLLDAGMEILGKKDHDALALRFFEKKSFAEVGSTLGASEDAAKMRVGRALEKMRKFFAKRGVHSTAGIIAGAISANSIQAAPIALASSVTAAASAKGAAVSTSTLILIKGALKTMAWTKTQTVMIAGAVILLATGTTTMVVYHQHHGAKKAGATPLSQADFPKGSWHFSGYADPESAFQTTFWAMNQGNAKSYLDSLAPDGSLMKDARGKSENEIITQIKQIVGGLAGYKIVDKKDISDDEVLITFQPEMDAGQGSPSPGRLVVRRVGDQWKVAG